MGLFDFLRRLLGGPPASSNDHSSVSHPLEAPVSSQESSAVPTVATGVRLRDPLRYRSSLNRTARTAERVPELPYRFARLSVDGDGYLDLSSDAYERWLEHFDLPVLRTPEELAAFLQLPVGKLAWLTHRFDEGSRPAGVREAHYHFHWVKKKTHGHRLIEAPKQTLRGVQQKILREILDHVPPHPAAHGFVTGRSIRTNAEPHVGQKILLKFDLENFYPSVRYSRLVSIFRSVGYSREVAIWLARLTTSAIPASLSFPQGDPSALWTYYPRHLPQGAATSPALANLSAFALDVRLAGLARKYDVHYTRYADDLTFSGTGRFGGALRDFIPLVKQIAKAERFVLHREKRKVLRNSQRQSVAGVVVNEKPNIARKDFDRLKAILHNCVKHGPSTQNHDDHPDFAAHLAGRIGHVLHLNAQRGEKLRQLYAQIDWSR